MTEDGSVVELALVIRLLDVGRLLERRLDRMMRAEVGLTLTQYSVLIRLRNAGGQARMTELANLLASTPSGVTYQVTQLERRGLASRVAASDDDRGVVARITPDGSAMLRALRQRRNDLIMESAIHPFEPAETAALHELLGRLQVHLRGEMLDVTMPDDAPPETIVDDGEALAG